MHGVSAVSAGLAGQVAATRSKPAAGAKPDGDGDHGVEAAAGSPPPGGSSGSSGALNRVA